MGNATATIKRFLANKNTVTLITIIVSAIILYGFYSWRVSKAVTTVYVCSATRAIPARTTITTEMTQTTKVLASQVSENMIKSCDQVVGKVSSYATEIPQNSYFYQSQIMTPEQMPNSVFDDIPDGFTIYNLAVDFCLEYCFCKPTVTSTPCDRHRWSHHPSHHARFLGKNPNPGNQPIATTCRASSDQACAAILSLLLVKVYAVHASFSP